MLFFILLLLDIVFYFIFLTIPPDIMFIAAFMTGSTVGDLVNTLLIMFL